MSHLTLAPSSAAKSSSKPNGIRTRWALARLMIFSGLCKTESASKGILVTTKKRLRQGGF